MGSPTAARKKRIRKIREYATQVDLFAHEFRSEDHLRKIVADLFRKMGHTGVKITHGANEKGKDILFYSSGPLGEKRLFACVVKNEPITGKADDHQHGTPTILNTARTVINQVQAGFEEPVADGRGADERVDSVYVISPYECSTAAIDAVKNSLQRSGQVSFICGQALLELFAKHWPEFLWFESTVLVSYLSALRKNIESDYAFANLILQKSAYLESSPSSSLDLYVEPTFSREVRPHRLTIDELSTVRLLKGSRYLFEIEDAVREIKRVDRLLEAARTGEPNTRMVDRKPSETLAIAGGILDIWEQGYRKLVLQLREEAARSGAGSADGFAASGAFTAAAFVAPPQNEVRVEMEPSSDFMARVVTVTDSVHADIKELRVETEVSTRFANQLPENAFEALRSPEFLTYCKVSEVAELVPEAFSVAQPSYMLDFGEDLLDQFDGSVLVTGPPGYGKTAFCRWHAVRDASRLVSKDASVLPVYRPLHPLSTGKLGAFEDVFFASTELRQLMEQQRAGQPPFTRIRLYLDGLDEVTSRERQSEILNLAKDGVLRWESVQVVVTARDHVTGADLRWLPRIRLRELTQAKVRLLAERWLGPDRLTVFFQRLQEVGPLLDLMKIPLLATLILAVYRKTSSVPPNKTNLYGLFVELLSGGWDFYKNVQRRPSRFSTRDKEVALARLAGMLQHQNRRDATEADFRTALKRSLSFLSPDWDQFLSEIVEDGLLVRVGSSLTFAHLSFQEFLAARDLRDHQGTRPKQALSWYLNGKDWWRESLAFYVTLSDRPADTDEWVLARALASNTTSADLIERVRYLRGCITAAFPAYRESVGARSLADQVENKFGNIGRATTAISDY